MQAIEFSSPNIGKPFHAGHLRSTLIGAYLARLHRWHGHPVTRINYLGDWGKQFGLIGAALPRHGDEGRLQRNPSRHLYEVYVAAVAEAGSDPAVDAEARRWVAALEAGEPGCVDTWRTVRELSLTEYERTYRRLGVAFDAVEGESQYSQGAVQVVGRLDAAGLLRREGNGAAVVDLEPEGLGAALVAKADGATLYLSRDVAAAVARQDALRPSKLMYVAGETQRLHFQQLFALLGRLGEPVAARCAHIGFGNIAGMSTRRGTAVFLSELLDEARDRMLEVLRRSPAKLERIPDPEAVAEALGLSAVVVQDLKSRRGRGYTFDWDRILQAEGDTGPFLQYSHARLASIERAVVEGGQGTEPASDDDLSLLTEPTAARLVLELARWPEVLEAALDTLEPSTVVQYLFGLARASARAHAALRVLGEVDPPRARARLQLFSRTRRVLGHGLELLGLVPQHRV